MTIIRLFRYTSLARHPSIVGYVSHTWVGTYRQARYREKVRDAHPTALASRVCKPVLHVLTVTYASHGA